MSGINLPWASFVPLEQTQYFAQSLYLKLMVLPVESGPVCCFTISLPGVVVEQVIAPISSKVRAAALTPRTATRSGVMRCIVGYLEAFSLSI